MIRCPGCGGRNETGARTCEWCGRSFVGERRSFPIPLLIGSVGGVMAILVVGLIIFALSSLRGGDSPASATPSLTASPPAIDPDEPDGEIEPEIDPAGGTASPPPGPTPFGGATASPASTEFVRIANTDGIGAFIRREPAANAPGIVAYRDGTVLRIVGPDTTVAGRAWRQVEDQRGTRGWVPREFLVASPTGF